MSTMIPFLTQKDLVKNKDGRLIPGGKIEVFDPVTNNHVEIYTYDSVNDTYVTAPNPIYLNNESRPSQSYFTDRLVLCVLYEHMGDFGDRRTGDDDSSWRYIRDWLGAFSSKSTLGDRSLHGLGELQEASPEASPVTVVGYWTDDDCEARTYTWDERSVVEPDNGYIVKSNNADIGRWILQFDGEYIPSTYYGVYPGSEANMNALLGYVEEIGDKKTAPGVYFKTGEYTASTVALITDKKILLDADTRFTRSDFTCRSVTVIGDATHWIVDLHVTDRTCPVHSSWYRSCVAFWQSGSDFLHIDKANFQTDKAINSTVQVTNRNIYGQNRLEQTYGDNGKMHFNGCNFVGGPFFSYEDKLKFTGTEFKDSWFSCSSAALDFENDVIVRTSDVNRIRLVNFRDTIGYIHAAMWDGQTTLDLEDRDLNSPVTLQESPFTTIRNVKSEYTFSLDTQHPEEYSLSVENCSIESFYFGGVNLTVKNSGIHMPIEPNHVQYCTAKGSTMTSDATFLNRNATWVFEDCTVGISFSPAQNNRDDEDFRVFNRCIINNCQLNVKRMRMTDCQVQNCIIRIFPYCTVQNGVDTYHLYAHFEGNKFYGEYPITFTKLELEDGVESQCGECLVDWTFRGNDFRGNEDGISCRYWSNRLGQWPTKQFIARSTENHQEYIGNTGSCPSDNALECFMTNGVDCEESFYWLDLGYDTFITLDRRNPARIMMDLTETDSVDYHARSRAVNGNGFGVRTKYTGNDGGEFACGQGCYIYPWSHLNDVNGNGDLFKASFSKWGKIEEADPSYYPYTWRFLNTSDMI